MSWGLRLLEGLGPHEAWYVSQRETVRKCSGVATAGGARCSMHELAGCREEVGEVWLKAS